MYVTRPISYYRNYPESLSLPPEGPNSGYLVIQDEEPDEIEIYGCLGMSNEQGLIHLPFPQNKNLTTKYLSGDDTFYHDLAFFPLLNQPLSRNRYYVIDSHEKHKGKAYTCSKEEDMTTCCFCNQITDVKPRPFDPDDTYQQFEIDIYPSRGSFYAKSVAHNAFPPYLLRREGWTIETKTPGNYNTLGEASGLDTALGARLPDLSFPLSRKSSKAVVIGKWYCPLMFIKDGTLTARDQMENSMFYDMTLEQRWE